MESFADWTNVAKPLTPDDGFQMESAPGNVEPHENSSSFACAIEGTEYIILAVPTTSTLTDKPNWSSILQGIGITDLPKLTVSELASRLNGEEDLSLRVNNLKQPHDGVTTLMTEGPDMENSLSWISIEIEDTVFTAPSSRLLKYEFFQTLLSKKARKNGLIPLKGISAEEFRTFIKLLYPLDQENVKLSKPQWITILKLATIWNIVELRERALNTINASHRLKNLEYVRLGKEFNIQSWLRRGYLGLVQHAAHISSADVTKLGLETAVGLHRAREALYRDYYAHYLSTVAPTRDALSARTLLQNLVNAELENRIQPIDACEKIRLARDLGVSEFLLAAYNELMNREASLTLEEVERLGLSTALSIWSARIALRKEHKEKVEKLCNISYRVDIESIVNEVFRDELNPPQPPSPPRAAVELEPSSSPLSPNEPVPEPHVLPEQPSSQPPESVSESSGPRLISWGPGRWGSGQIPKSSASSSEGDKGGKKKKKKK